MMTIQEKITDYLQMNRSPRTLKTYGVAMKVYYRIAGERELSAETYNLFLRKIKDINPSTQAIYRSAVRGFYLEYSEVSAADFERAKKRWVSRRGQRLPNFNREAIEKLINYAKQLDGDVESLRDRAFIYTLADTGLRISEACSLLRGDIDWQEQRAVVIGKEDKQAVVFFSNRAMDAIKTYLAVRQDGSTGKPLASLPLFAQHGKRAGKQVIPIQSGGMWKAIKERAAAIGVDKDIRIHDLRHYFVTVVYLATGDIKAAQELARHSSSSVTSRYAHLGGAIAQIYDDVFNHP